MSAPPYLSIVVASRNDEHGGNLMGRTQTFVNALLDQCREHSVEIELIFVEWNPPPDRPRLAEALRWSDGPCEIRIIEFPEALHRRYRHADILPLYQMIGKNVGIRRARGEFILATNIDILFSNELIQFVAARKFQKGLMYRIDRNDVDSNVSVEEPVAERLAYCEAHRIRLNTRLGAFAVNAEVVKEVLTEPQFRDGWFDEERDNGQSFRWAGNRAEILLPEGTAGALVLDIEPGPGVRWGPFDLEIEGAGKARIKRRSIVKIPVTGDRMVLCVDGGRYTIANDRRALNFRMFSCGIDEAFVGTMAAEPKEGFLPGLHRRLRGPRLIARVNEDPVPEPLPAPPPLLHTIASGDFMLMAREHWMDLRGYAEFDMYSMNLDSLLCWSAHHAGVREEVLEDPLRIYHIEHGIGSGWTPEGERQLFARLDKIGLPWIDYPKILDLVEDARKSGGSMVFNGEDWGHASENLPEIEPVPVHRK
jgi:hypothetical protein